MDILDLVCATGIIFDILRRAVGDDGSVIGVDFSNENQPSLFNFLNTSQRIYSYYCFR